MQQKYFQHFSKTNQIQYKKKSIYYDYIWVIWWYICSTNFFPLKFSKKLIYQFCIQFHLNDIGMYVNKYFTVYNTSICFSIKISSILNKLRSYFLYFFESNANCFFFFQYFLFLYWFLNLVESIEQSDIHFFCDLFPLI